MDDAKTAATAVAAAATSCGKCVIEKRGKEKLSPLFPSLSLSLFFSFSFFFSSIWLGLRQKFMKGEKALIHLLIYQFAKEKLFFAIFPSESYINRDREKY